MLVWHSEHTPSISFISMPVFELGLLTLKTIPGKRDSHTLNYC